MHLVGAVQLLLVKRWEAALTTRCGVEMQRAISDSVGQCALTLAMLLLMQMLLAGWIRCTRWVECGWWVGERWDRVELEKKR